jgi:hypothetical protein
MAFKEKVINIFPGTTQGAQTITLPISLLQLLSSLQPVLKSLS